MGGKLTKNKSTLVSGETKEQQKITTTTVENASSHLDVPIDEDKQQTAKTMNKKKESKLNKKSSKTTVDKSTNTQNYMLSSSSFSEQLIGDSMSTGNKNSLLCASTAQSNAAYQPETLNKDVQELWNACARNGITSGEIHINNQKTACDREYYTDTLNNAEEAMYAGPATAVVNSDEIHNEK